MAAALIPDGFTMDSKVEAMGRVPQINFKFRPALPEAIEELFYLRRLSPKDAIKANQDFLTKHLVAWDIQGTSGSEAITPDALRRVPYQVQQVMLDKIINAYTSDLDPN